MEKNSKTKWWKYLLAIPVVLGIDLLAMYAAGMADTAIARDGLGHPVPVFTMLVILLFGVITVVVILGALILCIRAIFKSRR